MSDFDKQALYWVAAVFVAVCASSVLVFMKSFQVGVVGSFLVIAMALALRYPRLGLWLFLIYLPFGGTITYSIGSIYQAVGGKVVYSSAYGLFHLAKDAFYFPALVGLAFSRLTLPPKSLLVGFFCLLGVSLGTLLLVNLPQQLTADSGSPLLMGIIGLKIFVGYIPLILCANYLIRDRTQLFVFMRLQVVLMLICCSLCVVQYLFLVNGVCAGSSSLPEPATFRASLQARCFVGGSLLYNPTANLLRLPGTFVSPWQWGWFLIANSFFAFAAVVGERSRLWQILSIAAMGLIALAAVISGQRIALLVVPIILLGLLVATQPKRRLPMALGSVAFLLVLVSRMQLVQQQLVSLVERWQYSPPPEFMVGQMSEVMRNSLTLLGNGLGRATSAARRLGEIRLIETFHARLLYEVGIVGTIAFLVLVTILTILTFNAYRSIHSSSLRRLGLCLWLFVLFISYNPYYYPLAVDPVAVYYWFVAGVLLKLPALEQQLPLDKDMADGMGHNYSR
ncbi:MAG: hypothetical protein ACFB4I_03695 [Cyanophyceae cyanobacterium]